MFGVSWNLRIVAASTVAALGLAVGFVASDQGGDGFGVIRAAPHADGVVATAAAQDLRERLSSMRRELAIRPEQDLVWRRYAEAMVTLDHATRDFEQRVVRGAEQDDGSERARHAFILTAALTDLKDGVSAEQFARARPLAEDLAGTLICKGLVGR